MKTAELEGAKVDYWVAKALGESQDLEIRRGGPFVWSDGAVAFVEFHPSTNWEHGGPIIERERIAVFFDKASRFTGTDPWIAGFNLEAVDGHRYSEDTADFASLEMEHGRGGPTPLIAAMRAFVASKFGGEVPDA